MSSGRATIHNTPVVLSVLARGRPRCVIACDPGFGCAHSRALPSIVCRCRFRLSLVLALLLLLGVSRPGVLDTAGRRLCCCRLRTDVRGGNPRFDINRSTPLSDRCSPSFAKAALNVKLLSLSTKVALFSSQVFRSWSFTVCRRCVSVRRVVGITLLTLTVVATDFAVRSRRLTSLLTSSAVASPMVSSVPATMTISLNVCVLAASSIISSISLKVAPDLLTTRIWLMKTRWKDACQRDLKSTGLRAGEETDRAMWRRKIISHTGDPT